MISEQHDRPYVAYAEPAATLTAPEFRYTPLPVLFASEAQADSVQGGAPMSQGPSHLLSAEFQCLVTRWRAETAQVSSAHDLVLHPAYLRIIGLGPVAIPLVLAELQHRPATWITALEALTGADPVPDGAHTFQAVREAWLQWGRSHGYL